MTREIQNYIICIATDCNELQQQIIRLSKKGYELQGGVSVNMVNNHERCYQAMVKYKKPDFSLSIDLDPIL